MQTKRSIWSVGGDDRLICVADRHRRRRSPNSSSSNHRFIDDKPPLPIIATATISAAMLRFNTFRAGVRSTTSTRRTERSWRCRARTTTATRRRPTTTTTTSACSRCRPDLAWCSRRASGIAARPTSLTPFGSSAFARTLRLHLTSPRPHRRAFMVSERARYVVDVDHHRSFSSVVRANSRNSRSARRSDSPFRLSPSISARDCRRCAVCAASAALA